VKHRHSVGTRGMDKVMASVNSFMAKVVVVVISCMVEALQGLGGDEESHHGLGGERNTPNVESPAGGDHRDKSR